MPTNFEKLEKLVDKALLKKPEECVLCHSSIQFGYPRYSRDGVTQRANRYACERLHGSPPFIDVEAAHSCGVRNCVNPFHLRWATAKENADDRDRHGRTGKGERNGNHKLTAIQVEEIRTLYAKGSITQRELSERYGVPGTAISRIVRGQGWKNVSGPVFSEAQTWRIQGEGHPRSKLTEEIVKLVRLRYSLRPRQTLLIMANQFGVSLSLLGLVVQRKIWRHI